MSTRQMENVIRHVRRAVLNNVSSLTDAQLLDSFLVEKDEAAFEALVRRHGPLVLAVCRRVLHNRHDAEDAFQATFLVLVRKAASIHRRELLANWLYGVAHRTALKARVAQARRRTKEQQVDNMPQKELAAERLPDERLAHLDEELSRLADKYRVPVLLCDLEGLSRKEAARQLGWPVGTLNWRLARARALLANRLTRRGLTLSAGTVAQVLSQNAASALVPTALVAATVKSGTVLAGGASGLIAGPVVALTEGVLKAMLLDKFKIGAVMILALVSIGTGAGLLTRASLSAGESGPNIQAAGAAPVAASQLEESQPPAGRTTHFRVEAPTPAIARRIGLAAERCRKEQALRWLGHELPNWPEPCLIRVSLRGGDFSSATTFAFDDGKVLQQAMTLEGRLDRILKVDLPHEMTHVVLAHHFGSPLPRWADEGVAFLSSDDFERRHFPREWNKLLSDPSRFIPLRRLFPRMDYPNDVLALYTEGYSVTRFLVESQDRRTFLEFLATGMSASWDQAVKQHYGYANVEALERAWRRRLTDGPKSSADADLLRGRWLSTAWEEGGKAAPRERATEFTLDFRNDRLAMEQGNKTVAFTVQLDPATAPKGMELRVLGSAIRGIYHLEGDRLTLCLGKPGGPRPRQFATSDKDQCKLIFLAREEAAGTSSNHPSQTQPPGVEQKLELAFGKDCADIRAAAMKLDLPSRHLVLAANQFSILKDGRVKFSPCWYASFDKEQITTIRCEEAYFTLDRAIADLAEFARRKIVAIEPSGRVRLTFRPTAAESKATPPR